MFYKKILSSKFLKSAGVYTITSIINKAIPFFLMPLLTVYLTPSDYGLLSMFGVLVTIVTPFVGLTLYSALARIYFDKNEIDVKTYTFNVLLLTIVSTIVVSILFNLFSDKISTLSSVPERYLWIVLVIAFSSCISQIVLTLWQVQVKPYQFGIYQILKSAAYASLSVLFVVGFGANWIGSIYAQMISAVLFFIIGVIVLLKNKSVKVKVNKTYIDHAFKYGVFLVPHALGGVLMSLTDRLFITNMVSINSTGLYTVGYQIGSIIGMLALSLNQAYQPWLYSKLKEDVYSIKIDIVRKTYLYFIGLLFSAVTLSLLAPTLLKIFIASDYAGAGQFVFWIALGYSFAGMYYTISGYIFYAQKTGYISAITLSLAVINVGLNYFFVSNYGAIGAAQATTIIYFLQFIFSWILAIKVYKMPWIQALKSSNIKKETTLK